MCGVLLFSLLHLKMLKQWKYRALQGMRCTMHDIIVFENLCFYLSQTMVSWHFHEDSILGIIFENLYHAWEH